jgi:hypothetical protein
MSPTPAKKATTSLSDLVGKNKEGKDVKDDNLENETEENKEAKDPGYLEDEAAKNDKENDQYLSPAVVSTNPNKTPAQLAAESADETAARYNIEDKVSEEDLKNPRVQVYEDTRLRQIPSGTHLHPDVALDYQNRGIAAPGTDNAQVRRMITDTYDFAPDAEGQDKFVKPEEDTNNDEENYESNPEKYTKDGNIRKTWHGDEDDEAKK